MYNDYGSLARDKAEQNLNSLDFPEFDPAGRGGRGEEGKRAALWKMAVFERKALDLATEELLREQDVDGIAARFLKMFVDVTDMYGMGRFMLSGILRVE